MASYEIWYHLYPKLMLHIVGTKSNFSLLKAILFPVGQIHHYYNFALLNTFPQHSAHITSDTLYMFVCKENLIANNLCHFQYPKKQVITYCVYISVTYMLASNQLIFSSD